MKAVAHQEHLAHPFPVENLGHAAHALPRAMPLILQEDRRGRHTVFDQICLARLRFGEAVASLPAASDDDDGR
jgi:hypothetical protein